MLACQRHLFAVDDRLSYFDCAAMAPLLSASVSAAAHGVEDRARPWLLSGESWFGPADERRTLLARLIGCAADDVALVPSTSYAAALCARACDWASSRSVVTLRDEFPSTLQTWRAAAKRTGLRIATVEPQDGEDWTGAVLRALGPEVGLVCVPTVRWTDGACLDLERIGQAVRAVGAMLFVDATQSLGAMPFDVRRVRPHFVAAAGYKWLLGPYGHSYLYVAPECQSGVPLEENWIGRDGAENFAALAEPRFRYRQGARRFDAGQQAGFELGAAACAALRQIEDWRVERISAALGRITARIEHSARSAGLRIAASGSRAPHILSVAIDDRGDLADRLAAFGVQASIRAGMLRLSPHLFVDEHDLDRVERLFHSIAAAAPTPAAARSCVEGQRCVQ